MNTLSYVEKGVGQPLILLHGNGETKECFKSQIEYFSRSFRVIAVDTPGHGESPRGEGEFTLSRFSRDLRDFVDLLRIDKAIILGFSDGANIALLFALAFPDRVKALVLNGGNLSPSGIRRSTQLPIEIGYKMALAFAKKSKKAAANAEMLGLMVNEPNISPNALKAVTVPALVIAGSNDMVKKEHTELIAKSLPFAEKVIIKGDHFIAYKKPDEFNKYVEKFLLKTV